VGAGSSRPPCTSFGEIEHLVAAAHHGAGVSPAGEVRADRPQALQPLQFPCRRSINLSVGPCGRAARLSPGQQHEVSRLSLEFVEPQFRSPSGPVWSNCDSRDGRCSATAPQIHPLRAARLTSDRGPPPKGPLRRSGKLVPQHAMHGPPPESLDWTKLHEGLARAPSWPVECSATLGLGIGSNETWRSSSRQQPPQRAPLPTKRCKLPRRSIRSVPGRATRPDAGPRADADPEGQSPGQAEPSPACDHGCSWRDAVTRKR